MKTVALYARVSTAEQSCSLQLDDLRRYAERRGFPIVGEYIDVGVSGSLCKRPQLDLLIADSRKKRFDVVLVWKFDRFARSLKQLIDSFEEFKALGIDFISFTEGIDTTTSAGQLMFHMVGAFAQFERDLIVERVRAGIAYAKANGKRIGRPPAEIDKQKVLELRASGKSLRQIAKHLNVPVSRVRRSLDRHRNVGSKV